MGTTNKGVRLASYSEALALNPRGRKKLRCPQCGALSFVPYIFEDSGEAVDLDECGRCDHQESCGYHKPPGEYFREYPERRPDNGMTPEERREAWQKHKDNLRHEHQLQERARLEKEILGEEAPEAPTMPENKPNPGIIRHSWKIVQNCEKRAYNWQNHPFFRFLVCRFGWEKVEEVFKLYHIGADKQGRTIFWQIDTEGEVHAGKIIKYNEDGHRAKNPDGTPEPGAATWVHSKLQKAGLMATDLELQQCLFGEHLLKLNVDDIPEGVCLVEAEKTAVICALYKPQYIWIATGGKYNLKPEKLDALQRYVQATRPLLVYPDLGAFDDWKARLEVLGDWMPYRISTLLEEVATDEDRAKGLDLADFIIRDKD